MVIVGMVLTGCGVSKDNANKATAEKKVALILPQSLGDGGPADDMNAAMKRAKNDLGVKTSVYEALQPAEYETSLRNFARQGNKLIITAFPGMIEPLKKVAPEFPDTHFVLIYGSEDFKVPNITAVDFATWEVNYVVGIAAGMMTETGKLGHIVGTEDNTIMANYNAFLKGAKTVRGDVTVTRINANSFEDPAKGKEISFSLINQGVDVLLGDSAKTTLGIIEASKEKGILVIGDSSDHSQLAPSNVLMDTQIGFGNSVYDQIEKFVKGSLKGGLTTATFNNGGIGLTRNTELGKNVPELSDKLQEVNKKVDEAIEAIKSGSLVIERNISR